LGTAFRGLDEGIAAEMDRRYEQASLLLVTANFELARLYRRQNQPEVAVPLLVEVVKIMTPASELGRQAYEELRQLKFVSTPYAPAP
jgi:transcriptional regulator of acetoin/glycerol metabolism